MQNTCAADWLRTIQHDHARSFGDGYTIGGARNQLHIDQGPPSKGPLSQDTRDGLIGALEEISQLLQTSD